MDGQITKRIGPGTQIRRPGQASIFHQLVTYLAAMSTASTSGSVACELSYVSSLGASLLKAGGSAADAIIATVLCVGVINSHHTGIGGGGFALVRTKEGKYEGVDFRNAAPVSSNFPCVLHLRLTARI